MSKTSDKKRVREFMETWGLEADGIRDELHALLAEVRREEREKKQAETGIAGVMSRAEPRIVALFKRLAPAGKPPSPDLLAEAHKEIAVIFKDELIASGMGEQSATALASVLVAATKIKVKA